MGQSTSLQHECFSPLETWEASVFQTEKMDNILDNSTEQIFAELETVLVGMIEQEDKEWYKSDQAFFQGQHDFQ